jgi:hypothetical protein
VGGGGGGGRKKKWKRKAMSEDEGRSDQLGLALVLSERLGAKPKPERSETPHTRPYPYTPYQQHQPDQTVLTKSPASVGSGMTERGSIILPVIYNSIIATCIYHYSCGPNKQSHLFPRTPRRHEDEEKGRLDHQEPCSRLMLAWLTHRS